MPTRAPIDPALLNPVSEPDLPQARTLPAEAYTSAQAFWHGSATLLRRVLGLRRARGGALRRQATRRPCGSARRGSCLCAARTARSAGFFNSCRHRGHELVPEGETRNLNAIKCPYHAWVYGLEGELAGAPRFSAIPGFDR